MIIMMISNIIHIVLIAECVCVGVGYAMGQFRDVVRRGRSAVERTEL